MNLIFTSQSHHARHACSLIHLAVKASHPHNFNDFLQIYSFSFQYAISIRWILKPLLNFIGDKLEDEYFITNPSIDIYTGIAATIMLIIFGAFAGYFGGRVDDLLMRITEIFQTIPSFIFAILLVAIMKPSIISIVIAIAVVSWPGVARLVRANFFQ